MQHGLMGFALSINSALEGREASIAVFISVALLASTMSYSDWFSIELSPPLKIVHLPGMAW